MSDGNFKCGVHDFSTNDVKEWDKHCLEFEHEYDLRTECQGCDKPLHIKPKQKVGLKSKRIPRGFKCKECMKIAIDAPEINEVGEIIINE